MTPQLFSNFDFTQLKSNDFKEDSVREVLILPILQALGYHNTQIVRSKTFNNPFVKTGSGKRQLQQTPDYLLKVEDTFAWLLDAKAPNENIINGGNVEQAYFYAIHPEVRTKFFALCNGHAFALFRQDEQTPLLYFELKDIEQYWDILNNFLAPNSFQSGKDFTYQSVKKASKGGANNDKPFDYLNQTLLGEQEVHKQTAKRHFGVHGYFTKQTWNVVAEYIKHFSQKGDVVLDPFGGSGVTAIEALMNDRKGIHLDLNPMSVFMVDSLTAPIKETELMETFNTIKEEYAKHEPKTDKQIADALLKYPYPKGLALPKGSDVEMVEHLFSPKQLAQLALLKHLIIKHSKQNNVKKSLLLSFSSTINKFNLTFHYTKTDGGGDSAIFRYYRYRIAPEPDSLDLWPIFETKFKKVLAAKREINYKINADSIHNLSVVQGTATNLAFIKSESIDYIYTDPPYGKKIPYLDLSTMWNAWLDLKVSEQDFEQEAIEGGEHHKSKENYNDLMAQSIREMYRVLKFDRWMSFVFAHKDPEFWHLIINTAEKCGFEYAGAVAQKNGQTSFKKRQNPFTVLSGQLIINFKKVRRPRYIMQASLGINIRDTITQTIEGVIAQNEGATLEQINDELIIKGLELGFLDLLKKEYTDLTPILLDLFDYDDKTERFFIKKDTPFKTHIDLDLRVRYYLLSYLRRMELEKKIATFDEIILHIIPLLRNGTTPESQTVLNVLKDIAEPIGIDGWQLKKIGQLRLFS
jgi:16S rRNA G966 N2-methylase RsmD